MRLLIPVFLWCLLSVNSAFAEMVVVVAKSSVVTNLTEREVRRIFLSKMSRLNNGERIQPFELSNQEYKAEFYHKVTGKTLHQLNSYWTALIFTGKGKPPRNLDDTQALLTEVVANPAAITYMPSEYLNEHLRVIHRVY